MAILGGLPLLHCRDIEATLDFYQSLFSFVLVNKREAQGRLDWAHLMHAGSSLMLQADGKGRADTGQAAISLYFFVDDLQALHHYIRAKNHPVSKISDTAYRMQEFSVQDPEGNRITVGQKLAAQNDA